MTTSRSALTYAPIPSDTVKGAAINELDTRVSALEGSIDDPMSVDLTDGVAATLFAEAIDSLGTGGGWVDYLVEVTDGTKQQAAKGRLQWGAADNAGTAKVTLESPVQVLAQTDDAQTLDVTFSTTISGLTTTFKVAADTSLTPTSMTIRFTKLAY